MSNVRADFDVRLFNYLQDKFPDHKLSDYEEATAYLYCQMIAEVNEQVHYYLRQERRRSRRPFLNEGVTDDEQ